MEKATVRKECETGVDVDDRRQHIRVPGPFEGTRAGFLPIPLQIFDLSLGGCFVNSLHEQQVGVVFSLRIDLPHEGPITLKALTLYRRQGGYAVRFIDMNDVTRKRLARALEKQDDASW